MADRGPEAVRVAGLDREARLRPAAAFFEAFPWEGAQAPETLPAGAFLEGL